MHEATNDGMVQEVVSASGGPWGGICADKQYTQILAEVFGTDFMNRLKLDHPNTWLNMLIDFETKKRGAKPGRTAGISMTISFQFAKLFEQYTGEKIEERIKKRESLGVKFRNGMLGVSGDALRNMYAEVIENIRSHLRQLLQEVNGKQPSRMFIVGGFAGSAYLQEFFTAEFDRYMKILVPEEAGMCVMKGAVLFGHDSKYISSRISRFNYGLLKDIPFRKSKHDENRKFVKDGREWIKVLKTLVRKGQTLNVSDIVSSTTTFRDGLEIVPITLMCTEIDTENPHHPSTTLLEVIVVTNPNTETKRRKITTSLQFGGTDIAMKVVDHDTGKEIQSTVQF